jgi:hypothetical protein
MGPFVLSAEVDAVVDHPQAIDDEAAMSFLGEEEGNADLSQVTVYIGYQ